MRTLGQQDQAESEALYEFLEREIIPAFYERRADGLPRKWIARMKASIAKLCPVFNMHRMVREYTSEYYRVAHERYARLSAEGGVRAKSLAGWLARLEHSCMGRLPQASRSRRCGPKARCSLAGAGQARVDQRTAELRESQQQLEKAAFFDSLTGLPNRRLLEERFTFCAAAARRRDDRFGLLLIDLDRFKETNDNLGHDAGDALLVETACRLTTTVREYDVVARMGGDEFVILLPETGDRTSIESACARILAALAEPMLFNGWVLRTGASIGIAVFLRPWRNVAGDVQVGRPCAV